LNDERLAVNDERLRRMMIASRMTSGSASLIPGDPQSKKVADGDISKAFSVGEGVAQRRMRLP